MKLKLKESIDAKDAWLKQVKHHRRRLKGLPRVGFNPDAGNVEHNISMLNMMLGSGEMLSNNPISGPFGGDVASGASMGESFNNKINDRGLIMSDEIRQYVLELVLAEFETGHILSEDYRTFKELVSDDGYRATKTMYDFYLECRELGPAGFYEEYQDELDFDPMFVAEYGDEDASKSSTDSIDSANGFKIFDKVHVKTFDFNGQIIDIKKAPSGRIIVEVRRDAADGFFDPYLFSPDELELISESLEESIISEALSNKEKLKRAYPELIQTREANTNESYDEKGNPERCEECNALLNDAGECPRCVHGDEEVLEQINEATLNEGPFDRLNKKMDKADKKINSKVDKLADPKNIGKILYSTYKDQGNTYLIDDEWKTSKEVLPSLRQAIESLASLDTSLTVITKDKLDPNLLKFIDTVVRDRNGYIIRRGLELINPGTLRFDPTRRDLIKIKDGFRAEDILSKPDSKNTSSNETSAKEEPKADDQAKEEPNENPQTNPAPNASGEPKASEQPETAEAPKEEPVKADWVTNDSIKAAITLRAKRKNGNATYYDKEGNIVDYGKINVDNIADIFVDKEGKVPFMKAMEEVKAGLAKRKAAAIKSAALFGESLDDEIEYDNLEEKVITYDALHDGDMDELLSLAREIGINTMGELEEFAEREMPSDLSLLDTLRKYRDDLGDDFELKENFDISPKTLVESYQETDIDISWFNV